MPTKFRAEKITIMRFSRHIAEDGICIPPECYVQLPDRVPVFYDDANQKQVGYAMVKRVGDRLVASMEILSHMKSVTRALGMVQKLYPGTIFVVLDAVEHVILGLRLSGILLGPSPNLDAKIKPLGDRVSCQTAKIDLH